MKESLEENGSMKILRAQVRKEIFNTLEGKKENQRPPPTQAEAFVHELFRGLLYFKFIYKIFNKFL